MSLGRAFLRFTAGSARTVSRGSGAYFAWVGFLVVLIVLGL